MRLQLTIGAAAITIAASVAMPLRAQDSALTAAYAAARVPISVENDALGGEGGRRLMGAVTDAQYVLVGEEHGTVEIPRYVRALLGTLRPAGFTRFAIEISPFGAERVNALARTKSPRAGLDTLYGDFIDAMAFYTLREEADLLGWALAPFYGAKPMEIVGPDYDIIGERAILRRLRQIAAPAARPAVDAVLRRAHEGFDLLKTSGNPSQLFSFSVSDTVLPTLRRAVRPAAGSEADRLLTILERSAAINVAMAKGDNYGSNVLRARNLVENYLVAHRAAPEARTLFKFGLNHVLRGANQTRTFDLGTLLPALAEERGKRSVTVAMLGGPGSRRAAFSIARIRYEPAEGEIGDREFASVRAAVPDGGSWLFDLAEVRRAVLRTQPKLPREEEVMLLGADYIVVIGGATPSTELPSRR